MFLTAYLSGGAKIRCCPQSLSRTAYLVDDYWPEFDRYLQATRTDRDYLMLPVDGRRRRKAKYAWNTSGFDRVSEYRSILALRTIQSIWLRIVRQRLYLGINKGAIAILEHESK
jgi:hypothetical protein